METFINFFFSGKNMETQTAKLPKFEGKLLIKTPVFISQIGFLEGNFGKAFLEEYKGRIKADYKNVSALLTPPLNFLCYDEDVVKGSNPFVVVLANQILRQEGLRTATQADLEKAFKINALNSIGYEDTGLVLRTEEDRDFPRNTPLAKDIGSQLRTKGIEFSSENPVMIPLTGLELANADNGYGLTFKLREDAQIYNAPVLGKKSGDFSSEDIDEITGLPTKLGEGSRILSTRDSGLSRLFLLGGSCISSEDCRLGIPGGFGRVVVVSAEGTSPQNSEK